MLEAINTLLALDSNTLLNEISNDTIKFYGCAKLVEI